MRPRGLALADAVLRAKATLRHTEERAVAAVERARQELANIEKQLEQEVLREPVLAAPAKRGTWHVGK